VWRSVPPGAALAALRAGSPARRWAAALGVAVFIALPVPDPMAPALTATLAADAQPLIFAAAYNPADGALTVTRTAGPDAAPGSDYELWVIVGEAAPVSLGVIEADSVTRALPDLAPGAILAVSLEAAGGVHHRRSGAGSGDGRRERRVTKA
jgi:anti-sigma-K factor RskA